MKKSNPKPKPENGASEPKSLSSEQLDMSGLLGMLATAKLADAERITKNRIIFGLLMLLLVSFATNLVQISYRPEPKLLGETTDGRIRPLPLLSDPLFSHEEVLGWSRRCVERIYRLSYVDWQKDIQNNTLCLSDKARNGFAASLSRIGVLNYLKPEMQGTVYASVETPILKGARLSPAGYTEWIIEVPYRLTVDGKNRGTIELTMTMRVRRVSLTWREEGIWVESYQVQPKRAGA